MGRKPALEELVMALEWFCGKRVFLTGHTGFKGSWLCRLLLRLGAEVTGYALAPDEDAPLYGWLAAEGQLRSVIGDVRDAAALQSAFAGANPDVVIHMAAQPLVRAGYARPAYTYEVNVMGTVNLLECVRRSKRVQSVVNVTTDKVYRNGERARGYRESDALDGYDPYANSKTCAELVTRTWRDCFFAGGPAVSTARAGNVIGGGDRAAGRIVPDCVRAALAGRCVTLRNPHSVRPYQHVLEPLYAYLLLCEKQAQSNSLAGSYNIGPGDADCITTGQLAGLFCAAWGQGASWRAEEESGAPHEAGLLRLNAGRARRALGWRPKWDVQTAVAKTVEWEKAAAQGENPAAVTGRQMDEYLYD